MVETSLGVYDDLDVFTVGRSSYISIEEFGRPSTSTIRDGSKDAQTSFGNQSKGNVNFRKGRMDGIVPYFDS